MKKQQIEKPLLARIADGTELTDQEVWNYAYSISQGGFEKWEIEKAGLTSEQYIETMRNLSARLKGIEKAERAAKSGKSMVDYPDGRTLDCGCVVYHKSQVMHASTGTACADCYDEMSD